MNAKTIRKYKNKSISQLLKIAQRHFNKYIRLRDSEGDYFTCISCGKVKSTDKMDCGHYIAVGYSGMLRFNEDNAHGQCRACNSFKHGNPIEYRKRLIQKIGVERVEILESLSRTAHKWDRAGLVYTIEQYKTKCKKL